MKSYIVHLVDSAEDDLARIWLQSPHPALIARQDADIHRLLATTPLSSGTLVIEDLYRIVSGSLVAYYSVIQSTNTVEICSFALLRTQL